MTQLTTEQQHQLEATADRAVAKLRDFYTALPADEQAVLTIILRQHLGGPNEQADDTTGHSAKIAAFFVLAWAANKALDQLFEPNPQVEQELSDRLFAGA